MRVSKRQDQTRSLVAATAARIMADEHLADFLSAKRKAAERLGLPTSGAHLPSNQEIELELSTHLRLFVPDQAQTLKELRETALKAMRLLREFQPRLSGGVLSGTANRHQAIEIQVEASPTEQISLFLEHHHIPYELAHKRARIAGQQVELPLYRFTAGEHRLEITALDEHNPDHQLALRQGKSSHTPAQAGIGQLEALLESS